MTNANHAGSAFTVAICVLEKSRSGDLQPFQLRSFRRKGSAAENERTTPGTRNVLHSNKGLATLGSHLG